MITRRDWIRLSAAAGAFLAVEGCTPAESGEAPAQESIGPEILRRPIPSTGEMLPAIGLGSSATFSRAARAEDFDALRPVLRTLVESGGSVFDTAPGYGASEEVAGTLAAELGITDDIFWATKLNVAGRGGGAADPAEARAQLDRSFERLRTEVIDLVQVHNLGDPDVQLPILFEAREAGRIRYVGITSTSERRYPDLAQVMRDWPLDFIGVDYAVDNRASAETILPLAQEQNIGVLVYAPFGRTRLWARTAGRELPEWAAEFDAESWAQFFLKFVLAHPAVTAATPATSDVEHMEDNLGAAMGRLPTEEHLQQMIAFIDGLPPAPERG